MHVCRNARTVVIISLALASSSLARADVAHATAQESEFPTEGVGAATGLAVGGIVGFFSGGLVVLAQTGLFGSPSIPQLLLGASAYALIVVAASALGSAAGGALAGRTREHDAIAGALGGAASVATSLFGSVVGGIVGGLFFPSPPGARFPFQTTNQANCEAVGFIIGGVVGIGLGGITSQLASDALE